MSAPAPDDFVVVYRTGDALDAHALTSRLIDEGIDAHVAGDLLGGGYGLTVGGLSWTEVWTPAGDQVAAASLIAQWRPQPSIPVRPIRYSMTALMLAMTMAAVGAAIIAAAASASIGVTRLLGLFEIVLLVTAVVIVIRRWIISAKRGSQPDAGMD